MPRTRARPGPVPRGLKSSERVDGQALETGDWAGLRVRESPGGARWNQDSLENEGGGEGLGCAEGVKGLFGLGSNGSGLH